LIQSSLNKLPTQLEGMAFMLHDPVDKLARPDRLAWSIYRFTSSTQHSKVHDYTCFQYATDYVLEAIAGVPGKWYMTGQGKGIRPQHLIYIQRNGTVEKYRVEHIDYYSSPSDMWSATLTKLG